MATKTKNVWTEYNGKKFGAVYAEYAKTADTDIAGNSLRLTIDGNTVTQIGEAQCGEVLTAAAPIVKSGNSLSLTHTTATFTTYVDSGDGTPLAVDEVELVDSIGGKELLARRAYQDKDGNDLTLGIEGVTNMVTDNSGEPVQDSYGNPLADAESDARVVSIGELPIWADRAEKDASGNDIEATYATKQELQDALGDLETILASI